MFNVPLAYYIGCWLGALALYFKQLNINKTKVMQFLQIINKNWEGQPLAVVLDAIIFSTIGTILGIGFTQPINLQQAIAAGIGWTGLLSVGTAKE